MKHIHWQVHLAFASKGLNPLSTACKREAKMSGKRICDSVRAVPMCILSPEIQSTTKNLLTPFVTNSFGREDGAWGRGVHYDLALWGWRITGQCPSPCA